MNRLPFGTKPACQIFQKEMEKLLRDCKGTVNLLDDIVLTGKTRQEHLINLEKVLTILKDYGFKLNKSKCCFFQSSITYLGHILDKDGLKKDRSKIAAMIDAPPPNNKTEMRSFIGMANYYGKFVKGMSTLMAPL